MGTESLRVKKTYTDKTKLNLVARDDTLRSGQLEIAVDQK